MNDRDQRKKQRREGKMKVRKERRKNEYTNEGEGKEGRRRTDGRKDKRMRGQDKKDKK